jgi:hypothetical protein
MTPAEEYQMECAFLTTKEDFEIFYRWTDCLARRENDGTDYHSGPHSLKYFRMCYELARPKRVLEIGFNLGHSAAIWLNLGVEFVTSFDSVLTDKMHRSIDAMEKQFPARFAFGKCTSRSMEDFGAARLGKPDFMFIDGCHDFDWVCDDIAFGLKGGIDTFFLDDYDSHHGPGVIEAVRHHKLVPLAIFGTMALCVTRDGMERRPDLY